MLDVDGYKKQFKHTASSRVERVVKVTPKRRLFLVTSVTPRIQTNNSTRYSLDGSPSQGECRRYFKKSKLIVGGFIPALFKEQQRGKKET